MNDWVVEVKDFEEELKEGLYTVLNKHGIDKVIEIINAKDKEIQSKLYHEIYSYNDRIRTASYNFKYYKKPIRKMTGYQNRYYLTNYVDLFTRFLDYLLTVISGSDFH